MNEERPRRRGRTTALIAAAAVLGALAGTATGYAVQYDREPTPLPPLAQPGLRYAAPKPATAGTTFRSVNANRWHKTEGDLRELLLPAPKGAKFKLRPGYEPVESFAATYSYPASMLTWLLKGDVRRVARTSWISGHRGVEIRLVQFRDHAPAEDFQRDQSRYIRDEDYAGNLGNAVPGVGIENGAAWVYSAADRAPGYNPYRQARAIIRRGDVVIDMWVGDGDDHITTGEMVSLAKRQLELL